jgi:hypothetical protein
MVVPGGPSDGDAVKVRRAGALRVVVVVLDAVGREVLVAARVVGGARRVVLVVGGVVV